MGDLKVEVDNADIVDLANDLSKVFGEAQGGIEYFIKVWARDKKKVDFFVEDTKEKETTHG